MDQSSFVDHLRERGVAVEVVEPASQPFLRSSGERLRLSGGRLTGPAVVESYCYDDATAAKRDTDQIRPDGSTLTMSVQWIAPPHFFRSERLVVLYVGSDLPLLTLLTELLGPQFAGQRHP